MNIIGPTQCYFLTQPHRAHNQFLSYAYSVKSLLKSGKNVLVIDFESAFLKGRDIEKQHEKLNLWNGDSSRLHVRKAQYKSVYPLHLQPAVN